MADYDPQPPTRKELYSIFKTQRLVRAFEKIFDLLPVGLNEILQYISDSKLQPIAVSSDYTALLGNYLILVDASAGPVTITLPDADLGVLTYETAASIAVSKVDASTNTVTIVPGVIGQTIVGEPSQSLIADAEILNFAAVDGNWELAS